MPWTPLSADFRCRESGPTGPLWHANICGLCLPREHLLLMANQQYPLRQVSYDGIKRQSGYLPRVPTEHSGLRQGHNLLEPEMTTHSIFLFFYINLAT